MNAFILLKQKNNRSRGEKKMNILVSACLLGIPCRYDGSGKRTEDIFTLSKYLTLIPVCPEQLGGLSTPREPSERIGDRIITNNGKDVTNEFLLGGKCALDIALLNDCKIAILKERSPSCGHKMVYDGSFTGRIIPGDGILAELLKSNGITVYGESELSNLIKLYCD